MAIYNPPIENLPIFDTNQFVNPNDPLTNNNAPLSYVRYPTAQGNVNFPSIQVQNNSILNGLVLAPSGITLGDSSSAVPLTLTPHSVISGTTGQSNIIQGMDAINATQMTCTTLNYTNLNPPIGSGRPFYTLIYNNITASGSGNLFNNQYISINFFYIDLSPKLTCNYYTLDLTNINLRLSPVGGDVFPVGLSAQIFISTTSGAIFDPTKGNYVNWTGITPTGLSSFTSPTTQTLYYLDDVLSSGTIYLNLQFNNTASSSSLFSFASTVDIFKAFATVSN